MFDKFSGVQLQGQLSRSVFDQLSIPQPSQVPALVAVPQSLSLQTLAQQHCQLQAVTQRGSATLHVCPTRANAALPQQRPGCSLGAGDTAGSTGSAAGRDSRTFPSLAMTMSNLSNDGQLHRAPGVCSPVEQS